MKNLYALAALSLSLSLFSCNKGDNLSDRGFVPLPTQISSSSGSFTLNAEQKIQISGNEESLRGIVSYFNQQLSKSLGFELESGTESGSIKIELEANNPEDESYELTISDEEILISANSPAGIFYGVQTLLQAMPVEVFAENTGMQSFEIPAGEIQDNPAYSYRGSMLDVSRHFLPVEDVKHYLDQMANLKLNYLHLHLSDDQGWRIEIKSWPQLTEIGAQTEVGGGEGGFFTQEDYKEIVRYAAERFITIVPEIDMPGHTNAALASYGDLNPGINLPDGDFETVTKSVDKAEDEFKGSNITREAAELYTGREVGFSTLDTDLDLTYEFIEDVVREIAEITPGPYFHIGGDESHVTAKDDYVYFIERVQEIVRDHGKTSIGWDEVATSKLLPGNVAQFWALEENAKLAVDQGNQILMSPAKKAYLDMQYDSTTRIGLHWAAYIELDSAYLWDPATYVDGISKSDILGVEAPLWTETVENRADTEYLVFPRLGALAEVAWSPASSRDWESFKSRIRVMGQRWENQGIGFYKSPLVNWE
ncbi:beta-N-acetylhexosaminidase [Algoriphagus hitonicola]|uniref:beta-N-acetylhexosaminidase n=1 Tax=Algoriphagus hitonicola TaxID=435880 RepID=A0A1I2R642_9BACT|nr:beta-N-acetylhexosaminidase [Algoriphagus hitonicola]SFG34969.1 hexosaminidase [Algoriphagus hitonicola]